MPELPEVETIRRDLARHLIGQTIVDVQILDTTVLTGHALRGKIRRRASAEEFKASTEGKTISAFHRRGKYIAMEFQGGTAVIFHLRMTGQMLLREPAGNERAVFRLKGKPGAGWLCFFDRRRFGEMLYAQNWKEAPAIRALGIEPLEDPMDANILKKIFNGRQAPIHSALLNQKLVSGLGNIYVAESLFHSKISPLRPAGKISMEKLAMLSDAIKKVLSQSVANRGYSMHTYVDAMGKKGRSQLFTVVYGKDGQPCAVCQAPLKRRVITGRGVVFCAACQK